jgi:hypothetical protein
MSSLPDWITAASTAATAIAAFVATIIAWRAYNRDGRAPLPVIEPEFDWSRADGFLSLRVIVRNQIYETVTIESLRVLAPRGATIAQTKPNDKGRSEIIPTADRFRELDWSVAPIGETSHSLRGRPHRRDVTWEWFYFSLPQSWRGGNVKVEFRISSAMRTIRDRRIVVSRHVKAAPETKIDASANNQA